MAEFLRSMFAWSGSIVFIALLSPALTFAVVIDLVGVADLSNPSNPDGFGSVPYRFEIGRTEVTNAQYAEFLNAVDPNGMNPNGIYDSDMGAMVNGRGGIFFDSAQVPGAKYQLEVNFANKPVVFVSWFDAARFANWLENGQPGGGGGTENGAYDLSLSDPTRNSQASWVLPSDDEWLKAAYYSPLLNSGGGGYWLYPTQSDQIPLAASCSAVGDVLNPGPNVANYDPGGDGECAWNGELVNVSTAGGATSESYYGATDLGGNVREWTDTPLPQSEVVVRGGDFGASSTSMKSTNGPNGRPRSAVSSQEGIRIVFVPPVPLCDDGVDNDLDGLVDLGDPGCADALDDSERASTLACDDGLDNDSDGWTDFVDADQDGMADPSSDPGCFGPSSFTESPECQNGVNDDFETGIDFDGGLSIWGIAVDQPDPHCVAFWDNREARSRGFLCGLGAELVLVLLPFFVMRARRSRLALSRTHSK